MKFPSPWTILAALFFSAVASPAQEPGPTFPGRLTLYRSLTGTPERFFPDFPLRVSLAASIGYDDNVLSSHDDRLGSGYDFVGLDVASRIGNDRTRLGADVLLGFIAYWNRPGRALDPDISLDLTFSHQLTRRLVFGLSSFTTYQAQPDFSLGAGLVNNVGIYVYTSNSIALEYQWTPRFATATSYTLNALYYDNSAVGATQNRLEHFFGQQFRFLVVPTVTAVAEYRFGYEQYLTTNFDSYSHFVLAGLDFMLTPRSQFTFRSGAEFRTNLFDGGGSPTYPYSESTLTYAYRAASYIQWYNRYGLEQPDNAGNNSQQVFRSGLRVLHSFGRHLKLSGGIYYAYKHFDQGPSSDENDVDAAVTASYQITRRSAVQAGYIFTRVFSEAAPQDYYRNRIFLGLAYSF